MRGRWKRSTRAHPRCPSRAFGPAAEQAAVQAALLHAAVRLLRPDGGRLVYATCSLAREENDAVVEKVRAPAGERRPRAVPARVAPAPYIPT